MAGYDYSSAGWYFVTICTKEKEYLLGTVVGADVLISPQVQLSEFGQAVEEVIASMPSIDKYVIMPNHVHMIIQIDDGFDLRRDGTAPPPSSRPTSLSDRVRIFKTLVTKEIGHSIFQTSFHDRIIRNKAEYQNFVSYHLLCKSTSLHFCQCFLLTLCLTS